MADSLSGFYPQKMIKLKQSPNVQIIRSAEKLYIIQTIKKLSKKAFL